MQRMNSNKKNHSRENVNVLTAVFFFKVCYTTTGI